MKYAYASYMKISQTPRMLGRACALEMERARATQLDLARCCGLTQSACARIMAGQRRPQPETLAALLRAPLWDAAPMARARIMIGHLRDEMSRAQYPGEDVALYPRPAASQPGSLRADLRTLADAARVDAGGDVAALLHDLAGIVSRGMDGA